MDRENAKQYIRQRISCKDYLDKSKSGLYACPFCGSGNGSNGTGALKLYDSNTWTCHACHRSGDVIDLFREQTGADYNTALHTLASMANIDIDEYTPARMPTPAKNDFTAWPESGETQRGNINTPVNGNADTEAAAAPEIAKDYTAYFAECRKRINDPAAASYLSARGISPATAAAYWIGYDPAADPAGSGHPTPRLIMPTSTGHYVGRSIDPNTPKAFAKMNNKGGHPAIFNNRALYAQDVQEVFVVEGIFDALSVIEAGAVAISLNSTSNADMLIKQLQERRTDATLILCLDNDEAGARAAATLKTGLQRLNINYIVADICGSYKDPNEALTGDRQAFTEAIQKAKQETAARPHSVADYIAHGMQAEIDRFREVKKTGYFNLDEESGGLYAGLYVVAAISSLGKTTFCHQTADQLAAAGHDVLFFSLEQSRLELVSKSISRQSAKNNMETAVSSLSIRRGVRTEATKKATADYAAAVADRLSIIEGNFSCNISFIGDYIRRYVKRTGTQPVVFVDYLQILQPEQDGNRQQSTREMVDSTITELKRISRELDLTVFVICSVNRSNYLTPIDFESLKESGGIEYTADCVYGLQLQCLNEEVFSKQEIKAKRERIKAAKAETPRKIELVCLKNRYGKPSFSCFYDYYPAVDLFVESEEPVEAQQPRKAARTAGRK